MKRSLIILVFLAISFATLAEEEQSFHFGLKAAPALAWLRTDTKDLNSDGSKFGFSYGLMTEFNFAKNYAFATGIDVAYRGGKFKSVATVGNSTTSYTSSYILQYIELPLTLKFKTVEIGYLKYYLQAGLAPGVNIRARQSFTSSTQTTISGTTTTADSSASDIDFQSNINSFNLSMIIGGGAEYTLSGSTVLLVGIQFSNGFLDVFKGDAKVNSNYLSLNLGILF